MTQIGMKITPIRRSAAARLDIRMCECFCSYFLCLKTIITIAFNSMMTDEKSNPTANRPRDNMTLFESFLGISGSSEQKETGLALVEVSSIASLPF